MPNFEGQRHGVVTRIAVRSCDEVFGRGRGASAGGAQSLLYAAVAGEEGGAAGAGASVHVEAHKVMYDDAAWQRYFRLWQPEGGAGHTSYFNRMCHGPAFHVAQADRTDLRHPASCDYE